MARRLKAPAKTKPNVSAEAAGEGAAPAPASGGNVTPETKKDAVLRCKAKQQELEKAREEMRKANNTYRAELKAAKAMGVDPSDIIWVLGEMKRDPEEINREIRSRNEMAVIMGLPIGVQLGLFADGQTVATKVDNAKQAAAERGEPTDPEAMGYEAGKSGKTLSTNPFDFETQSESFDAFEKGWGKGMSGNVLNTDNGVVQAVQH
jgi:hypothetical protein